MESESAEIGLNAGGIMFNLYINGIGLGFPLALIRMRRTTALIFERDVRWSRRARRTQGHSVSLRFAHKEVLVILPLRGPWYVFHFNVPARSEAAIVAVCTIVTLRHARSIRTPIRGAETWPLTYMDCCGESDIGLLASDVTCGLMTMTRRGVGRQSYGKISLRRDNLPFIRSISLFLGTSVNDLPLESASCALFAPVKPSARTSFEPSPPPLLLTCSGIIKRLQKRKAPFVFLCAFSKLRCGKPSGCRQPRKFHICQELGKPVLWRKGH